MPRQAQLRQKNGYWFTEAGNPSGHYFGPVSVLPFSQAKRQFHEYLKAISSIRSAVQQSSLTVYMLSHYFCEWLKQNRSDRTYDERRRHLERFCNFTVGGKVIANLLATDVQASDLLSFLEWLKPEKKMGAFTADKHATSIKAAFNWGVKHPSPIPHLPFGFRPFSSIEKFKKPVEVVRDDDLLTLEEIDAILKFADADLAPIRGRGTARKRTPEEWRKGEANPYRGFADLLRGYLHTGARTSELANATVGDFSRYSRQLLLGNHKRSKTTKEPTARQIITNGEVFAIVNNLCQGKQPTDAIFKDPKGRPWTRTRIDRRFKQVRELAGMRGDVTVYSFRHLFISEMLMCGNDVATIAKAAGTSIGMIERVYGHFRSEHLHDAQRHLDEARQKAREQATQKPDAA